MGSLDEVISRQFRQWELRGRGGHLFAQPVALEPPFVPFTGYRLPRQQVDDGRRPTALSRFWDSLTAPESEAECESEQEVPPDPEPAFRAMEEHVELQLTLPKTKPLPASSYEGWLHQVCRAGESFSFELLATSKEIVPQFAGAPRAMARVDRALPQFLPEVMTLPTHDALFLAWVESAPLFVSVTLGLGAEFMIPLASTKADVLSAVINTLEQLHTGELALYQVLIEPAQFDWAENIIPAVSDAAGKPIFVNRPELLGGAERKLASPFLAVVVRFAACAEDPARCWEIVSDMAAPFGAFSQRGSNFLMPLSNEGYEPSDQESDLLARTSHRTGMLLNADELIPFLSLPTAALSRRLRRQSARTRAAPEELQRQGSLLLGENPHAGRVAQVWLSPAHRVRHLHVLGASGMGKTTFLFNLLRQDIENGQGLALLDPHGDLVERVLGIIPPERVEDVVLVDPSDEEHIVGFNILAAHSDFERNLLASDLVGIFRRLSTSWGEQMNSVLRNAILAFLESAKGGTLADMRRFLLDGAFRKAFLRSVTDPDVVFYWERAFPQLTGNKSIGPVLTRLDEFLSRKPIRFMVSQEENRLDFADILDHGRILLVKLPQGQIGRENANLLGSIFVSKIQQMAMSRQRLKEGERRDFWVCLDEFHSFITPSMAEILTGARKYRVGLVLAHQELHQLEADRDVASAVLANCCTRVAFRVSDRDARELDSGFAHFETHDLQNLGIGDAICRVERSEADFNLRVLDQTSADPDATARIRERVIAASRAKYARPRAEVEAALLRKSQLSEPEREPTGRPAPASKTPTLPPPVDAPAPKPAESTPRVAPTMNVPQGAEASSVDATAAEPVVAEPPAMRLLPELGRGGAVHRDAQHRIKHAAEELGFRATLESQVGTGGADLFLERGDLRIAVEISVTTGVSHELGNLLKCLAGTDSHIAFVSSDDRKLEQVAERLQERVSAEEGARVNFYQLEAFIDHLQSLPQEPSAPVHSPTSAKPSRKKVKGWTVKTKVAEKTPEEEREKEEDALRSIAEALRNPQ